MSLGTDGFWLVAGSQEISAAPYSKEDYVLLCFHACIGRRVSGFELKARLVLVSVLVPGPLLFHGLNVEIKSDRTLWSCSREPQGGGTNAALEGLSSRPRDSAPRTERCCGSAELQEELPLGLKVVDVDAYFFFPGSSLLPLPSVPRAVVDHTFCSAPETERERDGGPSQAEFSYCLKTLPRRE